VVDDFAVVWTDKPAMMHLVRTLQMLYQVKINWAGSKYLGMDIDVDRTNRHVTLSMPGYIYRLLQRVRPDGVKGASTPGIYAPPNYHNPITHKTTVGTSSLASNDEKQLLQSVVGTLLYYSRAVDPSIATAVHYLGSIQSRPTTNDGEDGPGASILIITPQQWLTLLRFTRPTWSINSCLTPPT
jgi:hypothetical protein